MTRWIENKKPTNHVDIFDPSFPWRNGKPDWDTFRAAKQEERLQRNKGKKVKVGDLTSRCMVFDSGKFCQLKSYGMAELIIEGRDVMVPLCQKHKTIIVKEPT